MNTSSAKLMLCAVPSTSRTIKAKAMSFLFSSSLHFPLATTIFPPPKPSNPQHPRIESNKHTMTGSKITTFATAIGHMMIAALKFYFVALWESE